MRIYVGMRFAQKGVTTVVTPWAACPDSSLSDELLQLVKNRQNRQLCAIARTSSSPEKKLLRLGQACPPWPPLACLLGEEGGGAEISQRSSVERRKNCGAPFRSSDAAIRTLRPV